MRLTPALILFAFAVCAQTQARADDTEASLQYCLSSCYTAIRSYTGFDCKGQELGAPDSPVRKRCLALMDPPLPAIANGVNPQGASSAIGNAVIGSMSVPYGNQNNETCGPVISEGYTHPAPGFVIDGQIFYMPLHRIWTAKPVFFKIKRPGQPTEVFTLEKGNAPDYPPRIRSWGAYDDPTQSLNQTIAISDNPFARTVRTMTPEDQKKFKEVEDQAGKSTCANGDGGKCVFTLSLKRDALQPSNWVIGSGTSQGFRAGSDCTPAADGFKTGLLKDVARRISTSLRRNDLFGDISNATSAQKSKVLQDSYSAIQDSCLSPVARSCRDVINDGAKTRAFYLTTCQQFAATVTDQLNQIGIRLGKTTIKTPDISSASGGATAH